MPNKQFVHLHLHTEFSLLDGACRIDQLMMRIKDLGQTSVAITDHGAMFGCVDFYHAAKKAGIKPIIGCEVYVATRGMQDKVSRVDRNNHLVLLCKNEIGYRNLIKMVSDGYTQGFYSKPRVDKELLLKYHEGLICCSACLAGEVPQALLAGDYEKAKEVALWYENVFGKDNYYIEVQNHGLKEQQAILSGLLRLSNETKIGLVATNDAHYLTKDDAKVQGILVCIQTGKTVNDDDRLEFGTDEFYVKSTEEMYDLFADFEGACENTVKIAEMCNFDYEFGVVKLPTFTPENGQNNEEYFKELCEKGLKKHYGTPPSKEACERLEFEIEVISRMGYVNYYLIVADFIRFAVGKGIPVGPGRGSGAGSIAAYCVGITNIDPIKYGLLFERFLNPERVSMPDFDIDFCYERRQEVIDYVIQKYGDDHVAQIITFGTMAARGAIRDVGRVLDVPYQKVDAIAKLVPMELKMTLNKALKVSKQFANEYNNDPAVKELINVAIKLEGMPRHASTHAAGVVITPNKVSDYVPLSTNDGAIVTQFAMGTLEELGLLKMDFLGLRTLTVISDAEKMVKSYKPEFSINNVSYDDEAVYKLLSLGETDGVFQLESSGMKQTLLGLRPQNFEDIIALISLYRPGPMDSIPTYIRNRHNPKLVKYKTKKLAPILDLTYGCIVYQEQVMQICRELAGFSYGQADLVRRAMSKKKQDVMNEMRGHFVYGNTKENPGCVGCIANGIPENIADSIFDDMNSFASYAFNKSHAAAYAVLAYQTAWLKHHYPKEFMAALLTSVLDFTSKVIGYISECQRLEINVLPPDINESSTGFVVQENNIRYGLLALKNVGRNLIMNVIKEREQNGDYYSFYDFCKRMSGTEINKRAVESFIKAGAFDKLEKNRRAMLLSVEKILKSVETSRRKNLDGQLNLFEAADNSFVRDDYHLPECDEYTNDILLQQEKEVSGMFLSGHPMQKYQAIINKVSNCTIAQIVNDEEKNRDNKRVTLVCTIVKMKFFTTKTGDVMAFTTVEDLTGNMELIIFPKVLMRANEFVKENAVVFVKGRTSIKEDEEPKVLAEEIYSIESLNPEVVRVINSPPREGIYLKIASVSNEKYEQVKELLNVYKGEWPVYIRFEDTKKMTRTPSEMWAMNNSTLIKELETLLGKGNVAVRQ